MARRTASSFSFAHRLRGLNHEGTVFIQLRTVIQPGPVPQLEIRDEPSLPPRGLAEIFRPTRELTTDDRPRRHERLLDRKGVASHMPFPIDRRTLLMQRIEALRQMAEPAPMARHR